MMCPLGYDAWLLWHVTNACNLSCEYCITDEKCKQEPVQEIQIARLLKTLAIHERVFKINITGGGEPFLVPNIVEACVALTKNHFVSLNTNLICDAVKDFSMQVDATRVPYIVGSLHVEQLRRRNIVDKYVDHYRQLTDQGFRVVASVIAYPRDLPCADEYREYFAQREIPIVFKLFQGVCEGKEYPQAYTSEEVRTFNLAHEITQHYQQSRYCNAGYNVGYVTPDGSVYPCLNARDQTLGNIYEGFSFRSEVQRCAYTFCKSPLNKYDTQMYRDALTQCLGIRALPYVVYRNIMGFKQRLFGK